MTEGHENDVVLLRSGQIEWRISDLALRMDASDALSLIQKALKLMGWSTTNQLGLKVDDLVQVMANQRALADAQERLRANGRASTMEVVQRPVLVGQWGSTEETVEPQRPRERRFAKDLPGTKTAPPPRKTVVVRTVERTHGDPTIDVQLFEDPVEQLRYEINHAYLMTVPLSQRSQWPLAEYTMLPSFLADVESQNGALSRGQIIAAIVDIVSSRMNDVNARKPRPLREGGGDDGRPLIMRSDGAVAWRANISSGTPAARRIMWWRPPSGVIELARLATHDDVDVPER
jgi:hypothetical protein